MKLKSIHAENFKIFSKLDLELDGKSTVLFGVNGTGKSTALAVINYLFRVWVNRLNPSQGKAFESYSNDMVHIGATEMIIACNVEMLNDLYLLSRIYVKNRYGKNVFKYHRNQYSEFTNAMMERYYDNDENMPVFVNYGTNRSVLDIPLRIRKKHTFDKFSAFERAIENELDFRTFFEWYRNQEDIENEQKSETGNLDYSDRMLDCVRLAIESMLGNVSGLKVKRNPLCMKVKKGNKEIRVDMLSDGEKCTLALLGDLARRMAIANPTLDNPLEGEGIVLIDEIELHMHPSWQRRILGVLKNTFPNIQFIVTTHSPQILSEADENYNIFLLDSNDDGECNVQKIERMDGYDSNFILEEYMNTRSQNEKISGMLDYAYSLIGKKKYDEAESVINTLTEIMGENKAEIIEIKGFLLRSRLQDEKDN